MRQLLRQAADLLAKFVEDYDRDEHSPDHAGEAQSLIKQVDELMESGK